MRPSLVLVSLEGDIIENFQLLPLSRTREGEGDRVLREARSIVKAHDRTAAARRFVIVNASERARQNDGATRRMTAPRLRDKQSEMFRSADRLLLCPGGRVSWRNFPLVE